MKKLLITGGAGFIGTNFIYYTLKKHPQDRIICLDALTYAGNLQNLQVIQENPHFQFIHGDITDKEQLGKLFVQEQFDMVINFAAESHVDRSIENTEAFVRTNVLGVQVLLDACKSYNVKRFHQISTDEVYGELPLDRPEMYFTEKTPLNPSSPYSATKAAADLLTLSYYRTYKLPVSISRCSNNYGPYHFPEKLIPLMIIKAMNNQPLPVYGKGSNVRDWLYVEDHCRAVDLIVRDELSIGEIYNIGGHNERTNLEVVKSILRELDKPEDLITYVSDRPGHDLRYAIDPSKIIRKLAFQPNVKFQDGLKIVIEWYRQNQDWWKRLIKRNE